MTWLQRYWDWDRRLPHLILKRLGILHVSIMTVTVLSVQFFAKYARCEQARPGCFTDYTVPLILISFSYCNFWHTRIIAFIGFNLLCVVSIWMAKRYLRELRIRFGIHHESEFHRALHLEISSVQFKDHVTKQEARKTGAMFAHNRDSFNEHYEKAANKGAIYLEEKFVSEHHHRPRYAFVMNKVFPRSTLGYTRIIVLMGINFGVIAWGAMMLAFFPVPNDKFLGENIKIEWEFVKFDTGIANPLPEDALQFSLHNIGAYMLFNSFWAYNGLLIYLYIFHANAWIYTWFYTFISTTLTFGFFLWRDILFFDPTGLAMASGMAQLNTTPMLPAGQFNLCTNVAICTMRLVLYQETDPILGTYVDVELGIDYGALNISKETPLEHVHFDKTDEEVADLVLSTGLNARASKRPGGPSNNAGYHHVIVSTITDDSRTRSSKLPVKSEFSDDHDHIRTDGIAHEDDHVAIVRQNSQIKRTSQAIQRARAEAYMSSEKENQMDSMKTP